MMPLAAQPPATTPTLAQHVAMWYGLLGVPLVWAGHVLLCQTLVETACFGGVAQINAQPWHSVRWVLPLVSGAAFALALGGSLLARRVWHASAALHSPQHDTFRFLAWSSTAVAVAFTIALVFTISVLFVLPLERLCGVLQ
ncbi:cytochrome C oxidase subunit I [Paraburkholderia unamae]|uniref:Tripartite ATP-independent transporter DctQ subunit n=1 Tax=Paraburkholderia unamae TaxID=219649 RepID=A0ABX5KB25_9BURK|nr:cytochrome C oxidase subunit I [Paraburkholderia unamae]PVX61392.1 hypothetical protein C7402_14041 [Paraburkholderia unamae]RAR49320.1 hypothetical protein C7401_14641 [Paraburkholderia unamae]